MSVRAALLALILGILAGCSPTPEPNPPALPEITSYDVGARPRAVAVADFDQDDQLDVAAANSGETSVTLLFGQPGGWFDPGGVSYEAGNEPADIKAVDLDRDQDMDLVIANHETSQVSVLLNDGLGEFEPAPGSPFETSARPHIHSAAVSDFNGDGWPDVAVESADSQDIRLLPGGPDGLSEVISIPANTMPYYALGAGEGRADKPADILVPGHGNQTVQIIQYENVSLNFAGHELALTGKPWLVVGDDINGDLDYDLLVVITDGVEILLSSSAGFTPAPGSPFTIAGATEVASGDLDGDGLSDIVVGPWDGDNVVILRGGTFEQTTVEVCERPVGLEVADLDKDGRGEIIAACATEDRLVVLSQTLENAN